MLVSFFYIYLKKKKKKRRKEEEEEEEDKACRLKTLVNMSKSCKEQG
jgi:hypothetical protein